jgi:hypothetical protein
MDRDSSVGIAVYRIPVEARFFAHIQTGPGVYPAFCTMGTVSFPGVKRPGRGADHPPLIAPRSKERRAIPLPPLWAFGSVTEYLYLYLYQILSVQRRQCNGPHDTIQILT